MIETEGKYLASSKGKYLSCQHSHRTSTSKYRVAVGNGLVAGSWWKWSRYWRDLHQWAQHLLVFWILAKKWIRKESTTIYSRGRKSINFFFSNFGQTGKVLLSYPSNYRPSWACFQSSIFAHHCKMHLFVCCCCCCKVAVCQIIFGTGLRSTQLLASWTLLLTKKMMTWRQTSVVNFVME